MRLKHLAFAALLAFGLLAANAPAHAEPAGKKPAASSSKKAAKKPKYERTDHVVKKGDTVGKIANTYGVKTDDVMRWNKLPSAHAIRAGQRLEIYTPASAPASSEAASSKGGAKGSGKRTSHRTSYTVKKGDTLGKIAEKQGVSTKQLQAWNPKLKSSPHALKVGQKLTIVVEGPSDTSSSIGHAAKGKLVNGEQLPRSANYYIRNSARAFATNLTVTALLDTTAKLKKRHPSAPQIVIGDISLKGGGAMKPHKSHQSGRDVDLGYYHKGNRQLDNFEAMNRHNLDVERTWDYMMILLESGKVDYIFVDYGIQRLLYDHARAEGVSEAQLEKLLQYPHGKGASGPRIKHEPGHINHMHVRFSCASGDAHCH